MRIQCDTLKYARLLRKKGMKSDVGDEFMSTLTEIEIFNIVRHDVAIQTVAADSHLHATCCSVSSSLPEHAIGVI